MLPEEKTQYLTEPQTGNVLLSHPAVHSQLFIQKFYVISTTTVPQRTHHSSSPAPVQLEAFLSSWSVSSLQCLLSCLFLLFAVLVGIDLPLGIFKNSWIYLHMEISLSLFTVHENVVNNKKSVGLNSLS